MTRSLRFGLVGTGCWAQITHAPTLASTDGIEFAAVWGPNSGAAGELAGRYHATAHDDISACLANVDAVAFAVPPGVQAPIAVRAAKAGKHLLLEKPIAISAADGDALAGAVEQAGVTSVCSSPPGFRPTCGPGCARSRPPGGGLGCAVWLGSALRAGNPFNTPGAGTRAGCGTSPRT